MSLDLNSTKIYIYNTIKKFFTSSFNIKYHHSKNQIIGVLILLMLINNYFSVL